MSDMDYQRIYDEFIDDRLPKQDSLVLYETHHIIPKHFGGSDEKSNLIRLRPSDHLFAHILLAFIHGGQMIYAASNMSGQEKYLGRRSRQKYEFVRLKLRSLQAARGRAIWEDPELRERMGRHKIGNKYRQGVTPNVTEQMREKLSASMKGNQNPKGCKRSPETIEKIRQNTIAQHARRRAAK